MIAFQRVFIVVVCATSALGLSASGQTLKPPGDSKLAIVVFEDLQCPDCANASLVLKQQARANNVPLVRHDFPLPKHNWAFQAAVLARYFDNDGLGDAFRDYLYLYQPQITADNLRDRAQEFAARHKLTLPANVDPQGQLAVKVTADIELGKKIGINHTPTVYVVTGRPADPLVEVDPMGISARIRSLTTRSH